MDYDEDAAARERAHAEAATLYRKALNRDPNFLSGYESQEYWDAVAAELEALSEQNGIRVGLTLFDDIGAEALRLDKRGRPIR